MCFLKKLFGSKSPVKAKEDKLEKRTQKLIYKSEDHNVQRTVVKLTFSDKKTLRVNIYGGFHQYTDSGCDESNKRHGAYNNEMHEPVASVASIISSQHNAASFISTLSTQEQSYVDDKKDPQMARIGKVVFAEILDTNGFMEEFMVAHVVPKEEGEK